MEIQPFNYGTEQVRVVTRDGEPWFVAADVTSALGIANGRDAVNRLDSDGVGTADVIDSLGRGQAAKVLHESALYQLIFQSRVPGAKAFQRWVTAEVLPTIRKTGSYGAPDLSTPQGVLVLAELAASTARDLVAATERAAIAEGFREAIELNAGLTPREFLKKYLPDLRETDFNNILYRGGLLIDQRAQRVDPRGGRKPGKQHRHPGWAGKPYFYLHTAVDGDGIRREHVRVRPGQPELDLAAWFAARKHQVNRAVAL